MQANKVEKQLHMMLHIDLVPNLSTSRGKSEVGISTGMSDGVGSAKEEPNERYSKAQRIIVSEGRLLKAKVGCKVEQTVIVIDGYIQAIYVCRQWLCTLHVDPRPFRTSER